MTPHGTGFSIFFSPIPTGNSFVYEDNSVALKPGDKVNYWVLTISSTTGEGVQLLDQSYTYSGL